MWDGYYNNWKWLRKSEPVYVLVSQDCSPLDLDKSQSPQWPSGQYVWHLITDCHPGDEVYNKNFHVHQTCSYQILGP